VLRNADEGSLDEIGEWLHRLGTSDTSTNEQWRTLSTLVRRFPASLASFLIRLPCWFPGLWVKYRGAAVLVSSPAKYGVDSVIAEWAWPIGVSFGLVKPRPVVRDGQIVACPVSNLVMNFDRRVMAGAQAARFFKRIVDLLEHAQVELAAMLSSASSPTARPNGHPGSSLSPRPGP
jgi:2-oxoacid dehydrogenases acyltransferase (catalytic domain)